MTHRNKGTRLISFSNGKPCMWYLSRRTGGRWSDRAKAAYKSWRDYIIAVKGKMRHRVTLSTQSESAAWRMSLISSSGDLWCGVATGWVLDSMQRQV